MKNWQLVKIFPLMMLIVLFGLSCNSIQQVYSEKAETPIPIKVKTEITKDTLKARLIRKNVKFFEKDSDEKPYLYLLLRLKIVSAERPLKINLNGTDYEYDKLFVELHSIFKSREENGVFQEGTNVIDKRVTLAASESDIAFYNKEGIYIEDFESLIADLESETNQFYMDFVGLQKPQTPPPTPKIVPNKLEELKRNIPKTATPLPK